MDVYEAIYGRRSVRRFSEKDVPNTVVRKILESACQAPSAGNGQPWHFYVVPRGETRERLVEGRLKQSFVSQAPVVVVVCADASILEAGYGERGRNLYVVQDTAAAIQTLLLAAFAEGLGTCWKGAFEEDQVRQALDLPKNRRPVAMIGLGFPTEAPVSRGRKPLEEVATFL